MSKQPLVELALEHLLQELVTLVTWTFTVAMDQKELLSLDGLDDWLAVQLDPKLVVQVAKRPKVVVADE